MWPSRGTIRATVSHLEADILKLREAQLAAEHQLEDAIITELRGMGLVAASCAVQGRCRRLVGEYADAISSLQDEIAALIPPQREVMP